MFTTHNIVAGLASAIALMGAAGAQAGSMPFMPRGGGVGAPMGFAELCRRDAPTCGVPAAQLALLGVAGPVMMTPTSSVGPGPQRRLEASAAPARDDRDDADLIALETVEAFSVAEVEDFIPAGQTLAIGPIVAPTAVAAPTALAWSARSDREQVKLLNQINQSVNRAVKKASDLDIYGQPEYWTLPRLIDGKLYGDCEDYALEKRRQLIAAGVPEGALSLAVAVTNRGEGHAVLMITLKSGDWVLDNLTPWATPWEDLNYRWVQRQVPGTALWTSAV